jgi:hypothetical protein
LEVLSADIFAAYLTRNGLDYSCILPYDSRPTAHTALQPREERNYPGSKFWSQITLMVARYVDKCCFGQFSILVICAWWRMMLSQGNAYCLLYHDIYCCCFCGHKFSCVIVLSVPYKAVLHGLHSVIANFILVLIHWLGGNNLPSCCSQ